MTKSRFMELSRRDVMALAPAVAVTAGLTGFNGTAWAGPDCGGARGAQLALGYMAGSDGWGQLTGLMPTLETLGADVARDEAPLVAAGSLPHGDDAFAARGARLTLHGLIGEPTSSLPAMQLVAHYAPYHELSHLAWSYEGAESRCGTSASGFTLPVHRDHGVKLSLEVRAPDADPGTSEPALAEAVFALDDAFARPKLRRGAYLLAWDLPNRRRLTDPWPGLRAIVERIPEPEEDMPTTRKFTLHTGDGKPVSLPVLLLTLDYAETKMVA